MMREKFKETSRIFGEWNVGAYQWKAPKGYLDEFVAMLKQKKLLGTLCKGCGNIYVPPKEICGRCFEKIEDKVFVSNYGRLLAFLVSPPLQKGKVMIAGMDVVEMGILKEGETIILGIVQFDGSSSKMILPVLNTTPEKLRPGMRVRVIFAEEPEGKLSDLRGVEPVEDVKFI
ncbi:MAG: zinc ribbon domain-containing protein [Archaeoglobaceae archaeon]|nr:zinc ribbon domain-containing protein [Archaeoglobaceae archaeon]